ncbi:putative cytoplasm protein [Dioszegia hungarica]|uniref:Cytoplasm protein n=1 Tax=Dioszegia hungarica TaxID=4972 RepID=A0AA38H712_9TREE|nr:putative cytoplasm protein [Dioszegia hungarica]KAI9633504.1 putative cytoplasm protein [Dioszegia hungarica]
MDLYTTSFTLPHFTLRSPISPSERAASYPLSSAGSSPIPLLNVTSTPATLHDGSNPVDLDWEAVQKLAADITAREGCLVTVTRESSQNHPSDLLTSPKDAESTPSSAVVWNFHFSGTYKAVVAARGAILRESPRANRFALKVPRAVILESALSGSMKVKNEVQRRLEEIEVDTQAIITVDFPDLGRKGAKGSAAASATEPEEMNGVNGKGHSRSGGSGGSLASVTGSANDRPADGEKNATQEGVEAEQQAGLPKQATYGLEAERTCEIVISGKLERVQLAKVRILVLLDELHGLHVEPCEIDYKLHAIIAGRRRGVIQSIQEETATTIYFPVPLVGILNPPQPRPHPDHSAGYRSYQSFQSHSMSNLGPAGPSGMNGHSNGGAIGAGSSWTAGPHMPGPVGHGHFNGHGNGHPNGYHPSSHQSPVYNPHHHVQHPYQTPPPYFHPRPPRGVPHGQHPHPPFHKPQHQQHMNGMHGPPVHMQHTGVSSMSSFGTPGPNQAPRHIPTDQQQPNRQPHYRPNQYQHPPGHHPFQHQTHHMHQPHGMNGMGHANGPQGPNMGTGVPAYGQGPHPGLAVHNGEQGSMGKANQIWITGEFFGVQRARDMLLNIAMQKSKLVISRDTAILPRKLDWLLTERLEEVKIIMSDNATYMQVPSVGSQASLITVFGDHRTGIERTIRTLMAMSCEFYVASVWLLPLAYDVLVPQSTINPAQIQPVIKRISHATGAEVVFKSNCFEMHGSEAEVRAAVLMVLDLDIINGFHHEIRFQIELANEHRDFISGKKNGKINKIMKLANVRIKFETLNDYNFLIDIAGLGGNALKGLTLLQEELPADISFHVPENYHKRIIGVMGRNIQRIMKIYGVYVKFANDEELEALGGYADNEDNVVARTPAKNAVNLESLKRSIMELDRDYLTESIPVPRHYHRTLLGEKSIFIHDIERKTNSRFRFTYPESASDRLVIFGPESQVLIAAAMLLEHVPFEASLHVLASHDLTALVTSPDFVVFTETIKRDHQIAITPSANFGEADEAVFSFRCQRSPMEAMGVAREALEKYLEEHKIQIYPEDMPSRVDTFADAYSHFNQRLIDRRAQAAAELAAEQELKIAPLVRARPIPADVKAIFDAPSTNTLDGIRPVEDGERGFAGPLSYHDPRRGTEIWQSPKPVRSESMSTESRSKRGSDPLIPEKLRQATLGPGVPLGPAPGQGNGHAHPRGAAARTQSLDITSLNFSRTLSSGAGGFGVLPLSPAAILANSPNTASGQYFPSTTSGGLGLMGTKSFPYESPGLDGITSGEYGCLPRISRADAAAIGNVHV